MCYEWDAKKNLELHVRYGSRARKLWTTTAARHKPSSRVMPRDLLDSASESGSDGEDKDLQITINEHYAKAYEYRKWYYDCYDYLPGLHDWAVLVVVGHRCCCRVCDGRVCSCDV